MNAPNNRSHSENRVIVITGASAGVGRAAVRAFAKRYRDRARIGLLARGRDGLEGAKAEVEREGGRALVCVTDVADYAQVENAAARVEEELGPVDVWVNDAMVSMYSTFMDMTVEEFEHITRVTYLGYVHGTRAALQRMLPRDRGVIVQVSSALAHRSIPLQSAYCGAKHAINGFTEALRCELFHNNSRVRLSLVDLPGVNTTQFTWTKNNMGKKVRPTGPIFQPEVAADAIVFASENNRKEIWVGYPTTESVVGEKVASGLLDHYLSHAAWEGALRPESDSPSRPDNFWQPLPGDHGSHGPFDDQSHDASAQLWMGKHRKGLLATVAGIGLGAAAYAAYREHQTH
jgi:NAD(P)-dependent dehydrogenase (short-subunit alcohol dehydrogenase family)